MQQSLNMYLCTERYFNTNTKHKINKYMCNNWQHNQPYYNTLQYINPVYQVQTNAYIKVHKVFKKIVINSTNPSKTQHSYLCIFWFIPSHKSLSDELRIGWYCRWLVYTTGWCWPQNKVCPHTSVCPLINVTSIH